MLTHNVVFMVMVSLLVGEYHQQTWFLCQQVRVVQKLQIAGNAIKLPLKFLQIGREFQESGRNRQVVRSAFVGAAGQLTAGGDKLIFELDELFRFFRSEVKLQNKIRENG